MKKVGEYIIEKLIGSGIYGEVYKGSSTEEPGKLFAIKTIAKKNMPEKVFKHLEREVEILHMLNHPNIVKLIDIRATENHYYIVQEYCNGGDLSMFRRNKKGTVNEDTTRFIIKQLVKGLNEVYKKNAVHRDIKLTNVLLSYPNEESRLKEQPIVKLGDFGFARVMTQLESSEKCELVPLLENLLNAAPELFRKHTSSFKSDIWSLGIVTYEVLCGKKCFLGITKEELMRNIDKGIYEIPKRIKLSVECLDFLNACLQFDPDKRIEWKDLLDHKFVNDDKVTEFNFEVFKKVNGTPKDLPESEFSYSLSTKTRYKFFYSQEEHKSSLLENEEDNEYIKVDGSECSPNKIRSIESSDFIVLSTIGHASRSGT